MDQYNQKIEGHNFNQYITEEVWLDDCNACSTEAHNVNQITHECYVCSEFSPHITTYNFFDFLVLLCIPLSLVFFYRLFFKRK